MRSLRIQTDLEMLTAPKADLDSTTSQLPGQSKGLGKWGVISVFVYTAFVLYYTSNLVDAHYVNHSLSNLVTIPGVILLLFAYWRGFQAIKGNPAIGLKPILFFGIVFAAIAVCIPNFHSSDIYSYIDCGWQQARYHLNPYVTTVSETPNFGHDAMLTGVWSWNPFPYGFAFGHITRLICQLGMGDLLFTVRLMKLLNLAAYLGCGALIYWGGKRLQLTRPDLSLYLFLWSPLVLLHVLANGHNDILMTAFVMVGFFFATTSLIGLVSPFLIIGASIKYLWFLAAPFLTVWMWRRWRWKGLLLNLITGAATAALLSAAYIGDWRHFRFNVMQQDLSFNTKSLAALVGNIGHGIEQAFYGKQTLPWFESAITASIDVTKTVLFACFAVFSLSLFVKAVKDKDYSLLRVIENCVLLALLAVCAVSSKFYPWYLIMFFPVALMLPEQSHVRRLAIILSCTQLFAFTVLGHSGGINFAFLTALPMILSWRRWRREQWARKTAVFLAHQ